jgi:hypothetical protein
MDRAGKICPSIIYCLPLKKCWFLIKKIISSIWYKSGFWKFSKSGFLLMKVYFWCLTSFFFNIVYKIWVIIHILVSRKKKKLLIVCIDWRPLFCVSWNMIDWDFGSYFDGISIAITTVNSNYWDFSLSIFMEYLIMETFMLDWGKLFFIHAKAAPNS